MVEESDDLVVPGGFAVAFEEGGVGASFVVDDEEGDEVGFDGLNELGVGEDFGPEVATAFSAGDFLEEDEDGFSGLFGEGEGLVVVSEPGDVTDFDGVVFGFGEGGHWNQEKE